MQTKLAIKYAVTSVAILMISACGPSDDPLQAQAAQSTLLADSDILSIDFASASQARTQVRARVKRISKVLFGDVIGTTQADDGVDPEGQGGFKARADVPTVRVTQISDNDDLLLVNGAVAADHSESEDVGEDGGRRLFEDAMAQLTREQIDDVVGVDLKRVKMARLWQASVEAGRPETLHQSIKAYVFTAPRTVNGLEVLDSDLTIGVHRSGRVASIRSRGALPGKPLEASQAAPQRRAVSFEEIQKRLQSEYPDASVQSLGLVYPVSTRLDITQGRAVEPHEVFVVFDRLQDGSGYGRGRRIAYSVTDANAPGTFLDTQLLDDKGDPR